MEIGDALAARRDAHVDVLKESWQQVVLLDLGRQAST
jgi:hypothetical protein